MKLDTKPPASTLNLTASRHLAQHADTLRKPTQPLISSQIGELSVTAERKVDCDW